MPNDSSIPKRTWRQKFRDAFRGVGLSVRQERSYRVHFFFAALALGAGFALRVSGVQWCLLALCIAAVLAAETFNSALEQLAKAVDQQRNPHLQAALDMASGAVLIVAFGAVAVGLILFLPPIFQLLQGS
jgi:diacylglycerol kinase